MYYISKDLLKQSILYIEGILVRKREASAGRQMVNKRLRASKDLMIPSTEA